MNKLERLEELVRVVFPLAETKVDPALNIEGSWSLDIRLKREESPERFVVVQWWPKTEKFGVSDCADPVNPKDLWFLGPDKSCDDLTSALVEIREFLQK